uniref:NADH-plastoquinone oxidoreductase subunit 4L n=1 Tax=Selaginella sanguinolenta TaxID=493175 RepID=A0A482CKE8_9TRAC|nr:NADH-plastoquinone oxidoreductase subunit 4L [Selaginella sanguinolenta]QBL76368.1 NADH-plastoquinone oxidoreductase subunit 4L [Selaginella sanguinolenta]
MLERAPISGAFLFRTGIYGSIKSRNTARAPMCPESVPNAVNVNPVTSSSYLGARQMEGEISAISVTAIASAEAAIGSAIVPAIYRNARSIRIDQFDSLKR